MKLRSALLAATVLAAAPVVAKAQAISGLYIGAGAGANFMQPERIDNVTFAGAVPAAALRTGFNGPQRPSRSGLHRRRERPVTVSATASASKLKAASARTASRTPALA